MHNRKTRAYRRLALYGAGVLALGCSAGAAQAQTTLGPLIRVTGHSIFLRCTADKISTQPGTVYLNTTVEPSLAINPVDTSNLLISVQQDRWNNGGARGNRIDVSMNGGATFTATSTPGVTQCQHGPWPRASDPWCRSRPTAFRINRLWS